MFEKEINCPILDPGLVLKSGNILVKTGNFTLVKIAGEISRPIYANTDMPALVGSIAKDFQSVFVFGVKYNAVTGLNEFITTKGDDVAKLTKVKAENIPVLAPEYATLGFLLVINETAGAFAGGSDLSTSGITTIFVDNFGFVGY